MFRHTKGFIGTLLATIILVISTLTIAPAPAKAHCFAINCVEVDQRFNPNQDDSNVIIDIVTGVVVGVVVVVVGVPVFLWHLVSSTPENISSS